MLSTLKRRESIGQVALDSRSVLVASFSPCHEETVFGILQDIGLCSVAGKALPDVSLSHVHRSGICATMPDHVHASKTVEVRMSQIYGAKRAPELSFALGPVQPIHRLFLLCTGNHSTLGRLRVHSVEGSITPANRLPGPQPRPGRIATSSSSIGNHAREGTRLVGGRGLARTQRAGPPHSATPFSLRISQTRSGRIGISTCVTPRCASASTTALAIAGGAPTVADSPTPFAPSG